MKNNNLVIFFITCVLFTLNQAKAQTETNGKEKHVSITLFDEHIAAPFSARDDSPPHLGGTVSFETSRKRNGLYQFAHVFQARYYYHKDFNQVAFLAWKPKFELRFSEVFNVHAILGLGYAHSFPTQTSYRFEDGKYKKKTNWGKPHAMPSIGFGAGLHLNKLLDIPIEVFARYEAFGLAPYAPKGRIPVTLNTMTSIGIKYLFN